MCERRRYCANIVGVNRSHCAPTAPSAGSSKPAGGGRPLRGLRALRETDRLLLGSVVELCRRTARGTRAAPPASASTSQRGLDQVLPRHLCVRVRARSSACVTKASVTVWRHSCLHLEPFSFFFFRPVRTMSPSKRLCFGLKPAVALAQLLQPLCNIWVEIITSVSI